MKNIKTILTAFAVTLSALAASAAVSQSSSAINPLINDLGFKPAVIETVNDLVSDVTAISTNIAGVDSLGVVVQLNTATNIPDLTVITPSKQGALLIMPNCTNTFTVTATQVGSTSVVTVIYRQRQALNVTGTTNGWNKLPSDRQ